MSVRSTSIAHDKEFKEQHQALIKLRDIGSFKIVCDSVNDHFETLV
jgi:hypothetical protein